MTEQLFALTESQVDRLNRTMRKVETMLPDRTPHEHLAGDPPVWIYIGRTTEEIPAIEGKKPGVGNAEIYNLDVVEEELVPIELAPGVPYSQTVYNALCIDVPPESWVILNRDPYSGKYFVLWHICPCSGSGGYEL